MISDKKTILVVDDEEDIRDILETVLTGEGYKVVLASDGRAAVEALQKTHPQLIILDMNMPNMGGVAFYHDAVASRIDGRPKYPVLVFTGRDELKDLFRGFHVDGFLSKPFAVDDLLSEVKRILSAHEDKKTGAVYSGDKNFRILIAEEQDNCFDVMAQSLSQEGFPVLRTKKIEELPRDVKALHPDLVFMKVASTSLNGPEFLIASRLQALVWPRILRVIAYTHGVVEADERTVETLLNSAGVHSIIGSVRPELLLETARRLYAFKRRDQMPA